MVAENAGALSANYRVDTENKEAFLTIDTNWRPESKFLPELRQV